MKNSNEIKESYEACKVQGRSEWCPRKGVYKIIATNEKTCFKKPAIMAIVNWKPFQEDTFTETIFEIQMESFKNNADIDQLDALSSQTLEGKQIIVKEAMSAQNGSLVLVWEIITIRKTLLEELNYALKKSNYNVNFDDGIEWDGDDSGDLLSLIE